MKAFGAAWRGDAIRIRGITADARRAERYRALQSARQAERDAAAKTTVKAPKPNSTSPKGSNP